jgi:hypothetical protein
MSVAVIGESHFDVATSAQLAKPKGGEKDRAREFCESKGSRERTPQRADKHDRNHLGGQLGTSR